MNTLKGDVILETLNEELYELCQGDGVAFKTSSFILFRARRSGAKLGPVQMLAALSIALKYWYDDPPSLIELLSAFYGPTRGHRRLPLVLAAERELLRLIDWNIRAGGVVAA